MLSRIAIILNHISQDNLGESKIGLDPHINEYFLGTTGLATKIYHSLSINAHLILISFPSFNS